MTIYFTTLSSILDSYTKKNRFYILFKSLLTIVFNILLMFIGLVITDYQFS